MCEHCGAAGATAQIEHAGGHGYVVQRLCADRGACWARYDRQRAAAEREAVRR